MMVTLRGKHLFKFSSKVSLVAVVLLALGLASTLWIAQQNQDNRGHAQTIAPGNTYYVSPSGSDTNPGTQEAPWATLAKVAATVQAGDTVIFEDGIYNETELTRFANGGNESQRITLKARNKHQAHIHYIGHMNEARMWIDKPYITIQDFEITAEDWTDLVNTYDQLVAFRTGGEYGEAIGNKIHHVYEEGLKTGQTSNIFFKDNEVYDTRHEGIDAVNVANSTFENNYIHDVGRIGILVKGGSRNVKVVNNKYIQNLTTSNEAGIYLGGVTGSASTYDINGYEGYNLAAWNNVIVATTSGTIKYGLVNAGCKDCGFFNNVVVGPRYGLVVAKGGDPSGSGGTAWIAYPKDPIFKNNIIKNATTACTSIYHTIQGSLIIDANLFFNCPGVPTQAHPITGDPLFVQDLSDWHLQPGSPAIASGTALDTFPTYTDDKTPAVPPFDLKPDKDNVTRTALWDLGVYDYIIPTPTPTVEIPTLTPTPTLAPTLTWRNGVNITVTGNVLTKTGGVNGSWDAGASSEQTIPSGNGYAQITITQQDMNLTGRMFGLNHDNKTASQTDIDYAFYFAGSGKFQIYENGRRPTSLQGTYGVGDVFKVAIENGKANYYKNGTLVYASTQALVYPLFIDTSLNSLNSQIPTASLVTSPPSLTWKNGVNVTVTGNVLTKTGGVNGSWDAGAISEQTIPSGNGYAEIYITQQDMNLTGRMFGLNHNNTTVSYKDIDYAFYFAGSGKFQIYENGSRPTVLVGTYVPGDVFKVAVEDGKVTYYKNGAIVYVSTQPPVYPLFIDTSLNTINSQIATALLVN